MGSDSIMKKVLLIATVQSHICQFHKPLVKMLHENGFEVHVAARDNLDVKDGMKLDFVDKVFNIPFERSPFNIKNIPAYKELKKILKENSYSAIHTNTPVGGVLGRLSAKSQRKNGCKVIYTAHGFHFYKGASKKNWLIYYPIEAFMCRYTDALITISDEDYNLAVDKFNVDVFRIHGVGANTIKYNLNPLKESAEIKQKLGCSQNSKMIICTGELNSNKNQITAIKAMQEIVKEFPDVVLLLAGNGPNESELVKAVSDLNLQDNIKLLGYRKDLEYFVKASDIVVSCSKREGLGMNLIEGMLCKKPIVATVNRGHRELVVEGKNGFLVDTLDYIGLSQKIKQLLNDTELSAEFSKFGYKYAQKYTDTAVQKELFDIYSANGII